MLVDLGNVLADGDSVTVIKDLKVKGSSLVVKPEVTRELLMGKRVVGEDGGS